MTIERAKELLGQSAEQYSDEEIEKIISFLTAVAHIVLDSYLKERDG